ncbi:MAG TPA: adenylate/guanylate cyclase domain-containing protein [Candidatus Paceibacterota bacterium]|nr:adenylate/guanylate cyclase domain-containing protein [Verrucomicrobiota bacterium]HRY50603.1 adenylate/guanylate cyclase domain-containing protein [Candidatus Paceibacterota bacterium]HRZ99539.1 adenylate/guanylate cyclase domain-containing protein [Candidatus Paceibacterota bacterium]
MTPHIQRSIRGGLIGLLAAVGALALWLGGVLDGLEYTPWSWRVRTFAPGLPPHPQVKIVLLDQASLDWGKKENGWAWPWPRTVYSAVLDFCRRGGAKAVAFDVLYTEPSVYEAADDAALGDAVRRSSNFVGAVFLGSPSGATTQWPGDPVPIAPPIQGLDQWLTPHRAQQVVRSRATFPIPEIATNAALLANVSDRPDSDGLFRRAEQFRIFDGKVVPSLGLGTYLAAEKVAGRSPALRLNNGWLEVGNLRAPIDDEGRAILRFRGRNGTHESYSAAAVIQSELRLQAGEKPGLEPGVFKDAYVFFGFSAPGLLDSHPSPINRVYPGVEFHATSLDNLLTSEFLRDSPSAAVVIATLILGLLSGATITFSRKVWQSVLVFVGLLPMPVLAGFAAYPMGWWWPIVVIEGAVAAALIGGLVLNYATEGRQRAFLKRAFKHYLGADVIDQILADPARLRLGGEKRELTLFFSDIEKFSSFSEKLDPETLTGLLNDYLSDMTDIILEEGGYLDKYIGDAIVAFWNAPVDQSDHAVRAVRAVLRCHRMLAERRAVYQRKTGVIIQARIGMNTGDVTVGNMGSRDRFNYTVLGDAANLASRLEGANKTFGTYTMISETTWSRTNGEFLGRELGRIRVVGRQQPVRVYEILGFKGDPVPDFVTDFETGLTLCQTGQWQEALNHFERHPEDPPSATYAARCGKLAGTNGDTWDGIWNLTEK